TGVQTCALPISNRAHALNGIGRVKFSNLCTEIMQVSEVSDIEIYGKEDTIRYGISCNLGSLNIATVMDNNRIKESVKTAMRALTVVTDVTDIAMVPSIAKDRKSTRLNSSHVKISYAVFCLKKKSTYWSSSTLTYPRQTR